ncbi:MAG: hypothetical protein AAF360_01850 [Pseudomonadota bacterium]
MRILTGDPALARRGRHTHFQIMPLTPSALMKLVLVLCFALFNGPVPTAAMGEQVVICGADGAKRVVVFDFETGAPVDPAPVFEHCADCLASVAAAAPALAPTVSIRLSVSLLSVGDEARAPRADQPNAKRARAPPLSGNA